jgi:hypothetical protein
MANPELCRSSAETSDTLEMLYIGRFELSFIVQLERSTSTG